MATAPAKKPPAAPVKKVAPAKSAAKKTTTPPSKKAAPAKPAAVRKVVQAADAHLLAKPVIESPVVELDTAPPPVTELWLTHGEIFPDPHNLRTTMTDLSDLADSIAGVGLLEPLKVTPAHEANGGGWLLVAGHRRHAAIGNLIADGRWAKGKRIQCVTAAEASMMSADDRTVAQLVENLQRVDLNPVEEANGYQRLVEAGWKQNRIAGAVGRHQNRVGDRLALLKLPPVWLEKIAAGEMTLAIAKQLADCPPEVITALSKKPGIPNDYAIKDAITERKVAVATETVTSTAAARGLAFLKGKRTWEMQREYTEVHQTSPSGLAKVILPADTTLWAVTMETWGSNPAVYVWRPTSKDSSVDEVELTDFQKWANERDRLNAEHDKALQEHGRLRADVITDWAKTVVTTKDVAGAVMQYLIEWNQHSREEWARRLGWEKPKADKATQAAHLDEWYSHAANITAALALFLANGQWTPKSFKANLEEYVTSVVGPKPEAPTIPPSPAIDHDDNSTNDDDDDDESEDGGDDE